MLKLYVFVVAPLPRGPGLLLVCKLEPRASVAVWFSCFTPAQQVLPAKGLELGDERWVLHTFRYICRPCRTSYFRIERALVVITERCIRTKDATAAIAR